jgi:hypothetical protein
MLTSQVGIFRCRVLRIADHPREAIVDLSAAEKIYGRGWNAAKVMAFVCFGVACGLMVASLVLVPGSRAQGLSVQSVAAIVAPVR